VTTVAPEIDHLDRGEPPASRVAPDRPDLPGVPFPRVADDAYDAELEAIAELRARPAARTATFARLLAIAAAAALVWALRFDLAYAMSARAPVELGPNPTAEQLAGASHRLVSIDGIPGGVGAIDYRRPLRDGMYRLAPLVDRPDVYVELRLPDGVDPSRFVPPTRVQGHLVPLDQAGARFSHARAMIERASGKPAAGSTFLLELGAQPTLGAPSAVVALLAAALCLGQIAALGLSLRRTSRASSGSLG
jgi:hypothetical protein